MGDSDSDRSNQTPTSRLAAAVIAMFRASATGMQSNSSRDLRGNWAEPVDEFLRVACPPGGLIDESSRLRHPLGYLAQC